MLIFSDEGHTSSAPYTLSKTGVRQENLEIHDRVKAIVAGAQKSNAGMPNDTQTIVDDEQFNALLARVHHTDYLAYLKQQSHLLSSGQSELSQTYGPNYVAPDTPIYSGVYNMAISSAQLGYLAANAIKQHGYQYTYAVCRPPGHHAGPNYMGGYCYLNNALVAAQLLSDQDNVAIIDLDYHLGNGTADFVEAHPELIYYSIHSSNSSDYPYKIPKWDPTSVFNIGFEHAPTPTQYLDSVKQILADIEKRDVTQLVISIGFDIVKDDPHGSWQLGPEIFAQIGSLLKNSGLPICFIQEGGYNISKLEDCATYLFNSFCD